MLFKEIKKTGGFILIFLVFTRFSCYEEDKTLLTVLNINVVDKKDNVAVEGALIGLYSYDFCLLDTLSTDTEGSVEYALLNETFRVGGIAYVQTIPRLTNTSNQIDIKSGQKNDITLFIQLLQPVFDITVVTSYDSIFLKSIDREFTSVDQEQLLYCENIYGLDKINDKTVLYNNDLNTNFFLKGVFDKTNYLYIEKYLENMVSFDTLEISLMDEIYSILID